MKTTVNILLVLRLLAEAQDVDVLSELPLSELLAQKKLVSGEGSAERAPEALAVVGEPPETEISFKGMHRQASRKTFYEDDYEDEKGHMGKKKHKDKTHDLLNTSIMALSYLAFGGYLLCMIVSALREKRRYMMAYPTAASTTNNQFAQVLQHYMSHRPVRPFIRFPAVTVHQGGKKRRRRSAQREAPWKEPKHGPPDIDVIDYFEILFPDSG